MTSESSWPPQESLPPKLRAVVFEETWHLDAAKITNDVQRFDEICDGIYWFMEHGAHQCPAMPDSPFRMARATAPDGTRLRAFFTVNDDDEPAVRAWHVGVADEGPSADEDEF
jgi:hypothetical protein